MVFYQNKYRPLTHAILFPNVGSALADCPNGISFGFKFCDRRVFATPPSCDLGKIKQSAFLKILLKDFFVINPDHNAHRHNKRNDAKQDRPEK